MEPEIVEFDSGNEEIVEFSFGVLVTGNGGPNDLVQISDDPLNILEKRADGIYAAPKLSTADW